jgi:cobalt/nickel transport system ATP-binding protein
MNSAIPIINLSDIRFSYPGRQPVLNHLDFKFFKGDRVGLMAPNGSGKTTFFHLIMGLNQPTAGTMAFFGNPIETAKDFESIRRRIGLLFQDPDDQLFSPTVIEDVAFGPLNLGASKEDAVNIARQTLAKLGLKGFEDRITFKLSGGEKRLISLATILAMEPEVLLLDEPLNGLDQEACIKITETISQLEQSYIIISHDIEFLLKTTDKIYTLKKGALVYEEESKIHVHHHLHPHGEYPHKHD